MIAGLLFDLPTLSELQQRSVAERGLEDALSGRVPRSHAQVYTEAYGSGALFRQANERRIALVFGNSCRCPQCRTVYNDATSGTCWCTRPGTPLELGLAALYGPGDPDDDCEFFGAEALRQLCRDGVPVLTLQGERLNEQILVQ